MNHRLPEDGNGKHTLPQRKSLRLVEYDYAQEGAYFITVCTQQKACLFGDIIGDAMVLNDAGKMVEKVWDAIPEQYPGIETDEFVVMPNHVHGILVITDGLSLPDVVHRFKSMTTNHYIRGVKQQDWRAFDRKLWQRNYFERVIRHERELHDVRTYIANNPLKWALDHENPDYTQHPTHTP